MIITLLLSILITAVTLFFILRNKRVYTVSVMSTGKRNDVVLGTRVFLFESHAKDFCKICKLREVKYSASSDYIRIL